jgi:uncharacterized iron-regulated protein
MKLTVRTAKSPQIDYELKNCMAERDDAEGIANKPDNTADWKTYSKLINYVTKQNKEETMLWNKDKLYKER